MYSFINLSYSSSWCSLGKTDHFWKQIMSVDKYLYIFASQRKAFVYFISASWLVIAYDLVGDRCEDDITINKIFLLYFVKQKDSMLQWVCTVVGHRGIQSLHPMIISPPVTLLTALVNKSELTQVQNQLQLQLQHQNKKFMTIFH